MQVVAEHNVSTFWMKIDKKSLEVEDLCINEERTLYVSVKVALSAFLAVDQFRPVLGSDVIRREASLLLYLSLFTHIISARNKAN